MWNVDDLHEHLSNMYADVLLESKEYWLSYDVCDVEGMMDAVKLNHNCESCDICADFLI